MKTYNLLAFSIILDRETIFLLKNVALKKYLRTMTRLV